MKAEELKKIIYSKFMAMVKQDSKFYEIHAEEYADEIIELVAQSQLPKEENEFDGMEDYKMFKPLASSSPKEGEGVSDERGVVELAIAEIAGNGKYELAEQLRQVYDRLINDLAKLTRPTVTEEENNEWYRKGYFDGSLNRPVVTEDEDVEDTLKKLGLITTPTVLEGEEVYVRLDKFDKDGYIVHGKGDVIDFCIKKITLPTVSEDRLIDLFQTHASEQIFSHNVMTQSDFEAAIKELLNR